MSYLNKLQRFADHLVVGPLSKDYEKVNGLKIAKGNHLIFYQNVYYMILPWFEHELTKVFPHDFSHNFKGNVTFHPHPRISIPFVLPLYFNLSTEAFTHCFICGQQNIDLFGGKILSIISSPKDCGTHIRAYIARMRLIEAREEIIQERKVLIEKITRPSHKALYMERPPEEF